MSFSSYLANGFRMLAFSKEAIAAVRDDPKSVWYALGLYVLVSGFFGCLSFLSNDFLTGQPVIDSIVSSLFIAFILSMVLLFARLCRGSAPAVTVLPPLLFALLSVTVLLVFMALSEISGPIAVVLLAYFLLLMVFVVREVYQFSTMRAIVVVVALIGLLIGLYSQIAYWLYV